MGANKPKAHKDMKKIAEDPDDKLLSDFDNSVTNIGCDICGVRFTDAKSYEGHMQGKRHQKKVEEAKLKTKIVSDSKKNQDTDDDDDEDDNEDDEGLYCEVCDKHVSGYTSYVTHVKGKGHLKNLKKQKLKEKLGDMPDVLDDDGKDHSDDDDILPRLYAKCNTCQKEFFGPESYNMHLKGGAHKKKVKRAQAAESLKAEYEEETKRSDDEEPFSKCGVCQKSFSGVVPYKIHMESGAHKKSVEKKKIADEIKEFCANDDFKEGYVCKECNKTFTDPLAFKSHLANNSHEKQKAKSVLLEFLKDHPEIIVTYPKQTKDASGDESDSDSVDSSYFLICKLCNTSFSGPESAQDHVKSKKHLALKKEKKMRKLVKEQKKKASVNSEDSKSNDKNSPPVEEIHEKDKPESPGNFRENNADDFELI